MTADPPSEGSGGAPVPEDRLQEALAATARALEAIQHRFLDLPPSDPRLLDLRRRLKELVARVDAAAALRRDAARPTDR